ncbi:MAG: peptidase domain-containing ABC transporter [Ferruginibacter sp.]
MASFPFIQQKDLMDCGPTSLAMICRHYGKKIDIELLRNRSETGKGGVNLLGISNAAESIGMRTQAVQLSLPQLSGEARLPCILHWRQEHFVVLIRAGKNTFTIADPAQGIITLSKKEFLRLWASDSIDGESHGITLLLEPTPEFFRQQDQSPRKLGWGILFGYFLQQKKFIVQLVIGLLLGNILQLVFPFLTQSLVDNGINQNNLSFVYLVLIAQCMLFLGRTAVDFIRSRLLLYISTRINLSLLSDFWIKLMKLPLSYFDTKMTGDIIQRIGDHKRIESFLTGSALNTLFSLFNLLIFSVVLLNYHHYVFFIFLAGSILYLLWIRIFLKKRKMLDYSRFAVAARESAVTMQLVHGMQEIKLNSAEQLKRWEWESLQASLFKFSFKSLSLSQYQQAGAFFINEGKNILITFFVAKAVLDGQLTLGAMMAIQYIIGQLNSPVEQLVGFAQQAQDARISLSRLNEIHELQDEEPAGTSFIKQLPTEGSFIMHNLSFTYAGAGNLPVLKNVHIHIPAGKVTAIVGSSGSGKTTLLKLLLKFYDRYEGTIKIGAENLENISPSFWRTQCGSVMQEGYIFNDSIARNIAVSEETPDHERLKHACTVANILPFIHSLPMGWNTMIGAEGTGLSSGQKQRILIARAVYKNPAYLFFDEATNALDANNEKIIMENLQAFFKDKTVVIVAHRLSTVKHADNIIVLHNGEVSEWGSHQQLTDKRGHYFELVKNQLELGT